MVEALGLRRNPVLEIVEVGRDQRALGHREVVAAAGAAGGLQQATGVVQLVLSDQLAPLAREVGVLDGHRGSAPR